ncbi:MAG: hypothetical protein HY836_08505 [Aquabacterium sp.]|uniref:hypothetical protein n=1 Tax=Aquabacterium sp. TaxID=1872578 RepID=UPI0025BBC02F|nr:hypothetical protein [Aquabacterium sp.]MBI5925630.1 hypothetical protein [Aquabacterium sp.]
MQQTMPQKVGRLFMGAAIVLGALLNLGGCTTTLVQPYDEVLLNDTQSLFKKASAMVNDGIAKSPRTDHDRAAFKDKPTTHPAHVAQFEARYAELGSDSDALILRALSRSQQVSATGQSLESKVEELIEKHIPNACPDVDAELGTLSTGLTVRNYLDLKCLLLKWHEQHADLDVTESTGILKRSNWELRRATLFAAVLAIEKAELAKKK